MALFLERISSVPLQSDDFSFEFNSWLSVLVDALNESLREIQDSFNNSLQGLEVPNLTTAQITGYAATKPNGTLWYDTDTNELKAKVNGVVVVIA